MDGWFDVSRVPAAWFSEDAEPEGWFDETLLRGRGYGYRSLVVLGLGVSSKGRPGFRSLAVLGLGIGASGTIRLTANTGTFSYLGVDATLTYSTNRAGFVSLTGLPLGLGGFEIPEFPTLVAAAGSFTLNGVTTTLTPKRTVDVYWQDITGETGYRVYWGTTQGGPYPNSADVSADVLSYGIPGLTEHVTYYWYVVGLNGATEGDASDEGVFTVSIPPCIAEVASFAFSGINANMVRNRTLVADAGTFTLTGLAAGLTYSTGYTLNCDTAAYTLTGVETGLRYSWPSLIAATGTFTLTGVNNSFLAPYRMTADAGDFQWSGVDVTLTYAGAAYFMAADAGNFLFTNPAIDMVHGYILPCETGVYDLGGVDIAIQTNGTIERRNRDAGTNRRRRKKYEIQGQSFELTPDELDRVLKLVVERKQPPKALKQPVKAINKALKVTPTELVTFDHVPSFDPLWADLVMQQEYEAADRLRKTAEAFHRRMIAEDDMEVAMLLRMMMEQ